MTNYINIRNNGKYKKEHRVIWEQHYGPIAEGMDIDHINRNKKDNRIENLRLASRSENQANVAKRKNNKSGYKGVTAHRRKWRAQIQINNKIIYIGLYSTPIEAHSAYKKKAIELYGEYACWE